MGLGFRVQELPKHCRTCSFRGNQGSGQTPNPPAIDTETKAPQTCGCSACNPPDTVCVCVCCCLLAGALSDHAAAEAGQYQQQPSAFATPAAADGDCRDARRQHPAVVRCKALLRINREKKPSRPPSPPFLLYRWPRGVRGRAIVWLLLAVCVPSALLLMLVAKGFGGGNKANWYLSGEQAGWPAGWPDTRQYHVWVLLATCRQAASATRRALAHCFLHCATLPFSTRSGTDPLGCLSPCPTPPLPHTAAAAA